MKDFIIKFKYKGKRKQLTYKAKDYYDATRLVRAAYPECVIYEVDPAFVDNVIQVDFYNKVRKGA